MRVWGLGFRVWGLGFRVWGWGFGVWGLGFRVWGLGLLFGAVGFMTLGTSKGLGVRVFVLILWPKTIGPVQPCVRHKN